MTMRHGGGSAIAVMCLLGMYATASAYSGSTVYVPAGSFLMGNTGVGIEGDPWYNQNGYYDSEKPQHSVHLSAYRMGKYEVTRGEFKQFINAGGYWSSTYWSAEGWQWKLYQYGVNGGEPHGFSNATQWWGDPPGSFTQTDEYPVVDLSYWEAEAYCHWAGGHLPTEARWERAAHWTGSAPTVYPWGDAWDQERCNNWRDSRYVGFQTAPVGSYPGDASPSGCMDMAGNVSEWCSDRYGQDYYSQTPPAGWGDPTGPSAGGNRVIRGGSWNTGDHGDLVCRGAYRWYNNPGNWSDSVGFRVAVDVVPEPASAAVLPPVICLLILLRERRR